MAHAQAIAPRSVRPSAERIETGVYVEDVGTIRKIFLDRPSKKNAITRAMYSALAAALLEAAASERTDVVLLASSGGAFSAGTDLEEFWTRDPNGPATNESFAHTAGHFLHTLASFPKPIVAAVGGIALGVGASLLLHCDLVVAAHTAAFEFPLVGFTGLPEGGASVLLCARVGLQRASEWLLCGDRIDVETALRLGLVNVIVPGEELGHVALARAELLTRLPQSVVRETKRLLREPLRFAVDEAITREIEAISSRLSRMDSEAPRSTLRPGKR